MCICGCEWVSDIVARTEMKGDVYKYIRVVYTLEICMSAWMDVWISDIHRDSCLGTRRYVRM